MSSRAPSTSRSRANSTASLLSRSRTNSTASTLSRTSSLERRPSQQQRVRKLKDSCDECALSKVKCTREQPLCARCVARGLPCTYSLSRRRGKHKASPLVRNAPEWVVPPVSVAQPVAPMVGRDHQQAPVTAYIRPAAGYTAFADEALYAAYSREITPFYDSDPSSLYDDFSFVPADPAPCVAAVNATALLTMDTAADFFGLPSYDYDYDYDYTCPTYTTFPVALPLAPSPTPPPPPAQDCRALALQVLLDRHVPASTCPSTITRSHSHSHSHAPAPSTQQPATPNHSTLLQAAEKILACPCATTTAPDSAEVMLLVAQILRRVLAACARRTVSSTGNGTGGHLDVVAEVQAVGALVERFSAAAAAGGGKKGTSAWDGVRVQLARELRERVREAMGEVLRGSLCCV